MKLLLRFAFLLLVIAHVAPAQAVQGIIDDAQILTTAEEKRLESSLLALRSEKNIWMVVHTISTLSGIPIEGFANEEFQRWAIGQHRENNGLLFLISVNDRKMRLEVGYGLEGDLPDITAKHFIDSATPSFKQRRYAEGIATVIQAVAGLKYLPPEKAKQNTDGAPTTAQKLLAAFLMLSIICLFAARDKTEPRIASFLQSETDRFVKEWLRNRKSMSLRSTMKAILKLAVGFLCGTALLFVIPEGNPLEGLTILVVVVLFALIIFRTINSSKIPFNQLYNSLHGRRKEDFGNFLLSLNYAYSEEYNTFYPPAFLSASTGNTSSSDSNSNRNRNSSSSSAGNSERGSSFSGGGGSGGGGASSDW